jgi:hypothetical protein
MRDEWNPESEEEKGGAELSPDTSGEEEGSDLEDEDKLDGDDTLGKIDLRDY